MRGSLRDTGRHAGVRTAIMIAAIAALGAMALSCENSDPTAPEGSTLTLTADPQSTQPNVDTLITATLRSANGTRLPDQEIIFSTTTGTLTPSAQTPLLSDSQGQATSLLNTPSTATVTATSGKIIGSTTVNVSNCTIQTILLNLSQQVIPDCITQVEITLEAIDTAGGACGGVAVSVTANAPASGLNQLKGSLSLSQGVTNAFGIFKTTFTPSQSDCQNDCSIVVNPGAPNGGACEVDFVGQEFNSTTQSLPVTLGESVS